jgi:hypothetical protein
MKKQYTKRQITEAIAYWVKQLQRMDEQAGSIRMTMSPRAEVVVRAELPDGEEDGSSGGSESSS